MPPHDQLISCLRALTIRSPSCPRALSRAFTTSSVDQASTVQQRRRHRDPYALAQARGRKAANLSRQEVLKKERASALGDPVRGITTSFVQSFDTANSSSPVDPRSTESEAHLNFRLKESEVQASLARSEHLSVRAVRPSDEFEAEHGKPAADEDYARAKEALTRISSLANGSAKDRLRVNIERCISTFGRHKTEHTLPPRAPSSAAVIQASKGLQAQKMPRVGQDTGSSEVQIAILTARIRAIADYLETRGKTDKMNKRNLRLLVHKRQKLLTYLRRKERGGPRWTHVIETLGLTEGTWKGEISL